MILPNPGGKVGHRRTHTRITPHNCVGGDSISRPIRILNSQLSRESGYRILGIRGPGQAGRQRRAASPAGVQYRRTATRTTRSALGAALVGTQTAPVAPSPTPIRRRGAAPSRARRFRPTSKPDSWHPRSAGTHHSWTAPPPTSSPAIWWRPVNSSTKTPRRRWPMPGPPAPAPAGSPPSARPSASPPTTAVTGRRHSPSCGPPAGWAASRRCLPLIADCERGVGRPERAIELARSPEAAQLTGDDADELRIVVAGARVRPGAARAGPGDLVDAATGSDAHRADGRPPVLRLRRNAARARPWSKKRCSGSSTPPPRTSRA